MPVEVHQHGAVGIALAPRPVIHAQGGGRHTVGLWRTTDQAQQCISAHHRPQRSAEARTRCPAQRQAYGRESLREARRSPGPGHSHSRQAFGKDTTCAAGRIAEETSDLQPDRDGRGAPGQVGEGALVAAMNAPRSLMTKWTARRTLASTQGQSDRRRSGVEMPGFQPNAGGVRQQAREKRAHPIYKDVVTLGRDVAMLQPHSSKVAKTPNVSRKRCLLSSRSVSVIDPLHLPLK
ncbi:MAG: hypothetical protein JO150_13810 [Acidobacteriaceae bacterium]|nr:hypothetical protein [Acidobacteriaceae bacterium]